jgi:NAD(P)-dependent dehydrogenase (short-subunit alcohol dehydrogenase family)
VAQSPTPYNDICHSKLNGMAGIVHFADKTLRRLTMKLSGRVALVTGGGSGLGETAAKRMAAEGAAVVVADFDARAGQRVAESIRSAGGISSFVSVDVAETQSVEQMVRQTLETYRQIDILLTSAGVFHPGSVLDTTESDWDRQININLKGTFLCAHHCLPTMIQRKTGNIITMGSAAGMHPISRNAAYGPSKAGVIYLTQLIALEHGADGIRANCVCPGNIETSLLLNSIAQETNPEQVLQKAHRAAVLGRLGKPEEVAELVLFLATDDSAYMTGATLVLDGGRLLKLS